MSKEWTDKELVEILVDWHGYAHGGGMIGACNNEKCQAALAEIKARISRKPKQKVSREFVQKWKRTFKAMDGCYTPSTILIEFAEAFIKEAEMEVEK